MLPRCCPLQIGTISVLQIHRPSESSARRPSFRVAGQFCVRWFGMHIDVHVRVHGLQLKPEAETCSAVLLHAEA